MGMKKYNALSTEEHEIIIGSLLGDGSIQKTIRPTYNSCFRILRSKSDIKYLRWQRSKLDNLCSSAKISCMSYKDKRTGKTYHRASFGTKCMPSLSALRTQWYSSKGTKKLPSNIYLTPLIVAVWFCDDGCFYFTKQKQLSCSFATDCFTKQEVRRLIHILNDFVGDKLFAINAHEGKFIIVGGTTASLILYQMIHYHIKDMRMSRKLVPVKEFLSYRKSSNMRTTTTVRKEINKALLI